MDDIKSRLADMENDWTTTAPRTTEIGAKLPAGEHTVTLKKSEVFVTSAGKLVWLLAFQDEHGREIDKWNELERKQSVEYIKGDALMLGYQGPFVDLADWAPTVVGSACRIRVKVVPSDQGGDPFVRVYLNEVIDLKTAAVPAPSTPTTTSSGPGTTPVDDIPFAPTTMDSFL